LNATDVYIKTELGAQEVSTKKLDIAHRLRCGLIMVDGLLTVVALQREAKKLAAPDDFIEQLVTLGLIVKKSGVSPTPATAIGAAAQPSQGADDEYARFRAAKDFMTSTIVNAVGMRSFFFTLKMEKMATRADLKALLPDYGKAMGKAMGPDVAQAMLSRLNLMLD
jgi:hypothetical protein